MDGCEILHQLIDGKNPIVCRVSTILLVAQDFATIHSIVAYPIGFFVKVRNYAEVSTPTVN